AWCLLVFFLPFVGSLLFLLFGYQHVHRPLKRKRKHKRQFRLTHATALPPPVSGQEESGQPDCSWQGMSRLAQRFGAFAATSGNRLRLYHEGQAALDDILAAIAAARHHVHLEYFILQPDAT